MVRTFIAVVEKISGFLGWVSGVLICVLACMLVYDVFMRFVLNSPVDWTLDVTQLLQAAIAFLAASYVLKVGGHVNMSAVVAYMSPAWQRRMAIATAMITAGASAWMAILSWSLFTQSLHISERSFGIELPLAPWKLMVPVGFAIMALQGLAMGLKACIDPQAAASAGKGGH